MHLELNLQNHDSGRHLIHQFHKKKGFNEMHEYVAAMCMCVHICI